MFETVEDEFEIVHMCYDVSRRSLVLVVESRDDVPPIETGDDIRPEHFKCTIKTSGVRGNVVYVSDYSIAEAKSYDPDWPPGVAPSKLLRPRAIHRGRAYAIEV